MRKTFLIFLIVFLTAQIAQGADEMRLTAVVTGTRNPTSEEAGKSILKLQVSGQGELFDEREIPIDENLQPSQKNAALKAEAVKMAKEAFPSTWANASANDVDLWGQAS